MLRGFSSEKSVDMRNHELALDHGIPEDSDTKYLLEKRFLNPKINREWGLFVPEEYLHLLHDDEKVPGRLIELQNNNQIELHSFVPMLFRYLEREWIDHFFKTGKLRLSSFKRFTNHKDEQRGDKSEGTNIIKGNLGKYTSLSVMSVGGDCYVLSTSLIEDDGLMNEFDVDSYFVIQDPVGFMNEIAHQIKGCYVVKFGPCLYQKKSTIERTVKDYDPELLKSDSDTNTIDMNKSFNFNANLGGDEMYFKKLAKYSNQHEFRFIWHTRELPIQEFIDIVIPNPEKFCRIVSL